MTKITKSELRAHVNATGSHFFDRETMRAWGDTMANFAVDSADVETRSGLVVSCWELSRKRVMKGQPNVFHFAKDDYRRVFPGKESL